MKATGIVRRIDDLGRVVIPKEIRRTLRIREGDPLEIFTDREGEVILKKYSPIGELGDFAAEYAESLHNTSGHIICVADRDSIIAVSGASKKEYLEKQLSGELEKIMESKSTFVAPSVDAAKVTILNDENGDKYTSQVITPIISEGDPIGAIMFLSTDPKTKMGDVETKLAQSAANFLGKHMEQ
ncbi:MAG: stage V sporulation protein T [Clostridiaceae bacterium]|nr:stage V sporulation protein T [Clostridiaceae bacterium]